MNSYNLGSKITRANTVRIIGLCVLHVKVIIALVWAVVKAKEVATKLLMSMYDTMKRRMETTPTYLGCLDLGSTIPESDQNCKLQWLGAG